MHNTAIFTISSNNYFPFAKTLLQSVREFHNDVDLFFLLVDEVADDKILNDNHLFRICLVKDIGIQDYKKMAFAYDIIEFNTAVKPFFFNYLFNQGYKKVIYLDPDILVCNRLDAALDALNDHSIVVTPHQLAPVKNVDSFIPYLQWEQSALSTGIFNLGFIGVANTEEGRSFIDWLSNRCNFFCYYDIETGLFVDQKWINLAVCFFPSTYILRHKGYNMAAWNLHDRVLINNNVNGVEPLVFYHFSSIDMNDREIISKHDKTLKLKDRSDLIDLFNSYREKVNNNGYDYFHKLPYSFDYFSDGRKINLLERRLYAAVANNFSNPFNTPGDHFYTVLKIKRKSNRKVYNRRNDSLINRLLMLCLKIIFKLLGARRYANLVMSSKYLDRLRLHTFLIEEL